MPVFLLGLATFLLAGPDDQFDVLPPPPPKRLSVGETIERMRSARASRPAVKVYALLVGDTENEDLGQPSAVDLKRVRGILEDSLSSKELVVSEIKGKGSLKKALVDTLAAIPVSSDRVTILVYVTSHGGIDSEGRHYIQLSGERLWRASIEAAIRRAEPQLGILLTDTCASLGEIKPRDIHAYMNWAEGKKLIDAVLGGNPMVTNKETVRGLVLSHKGFVDINSCSQDQQAQADRKRGGFFTAAFAMACCHSTAGMAPPPRRSTNLPNHLQGKVEGKDFNVLNKVDRNGDGFIDWMEFTNWLVTPYLGIFFESAHQKPWIIRLH